MAGVGHGLAGARRGGVLHPGDDVSHLTRAQFTHPGRRRGPHPQLLHAVDGPGLHEPHLRGGPQRALHDPYRADHSPVVVEVGVEDQGLQLGIRVGAGGGNPFGDRVEQVRHALAGLGGDAKHLFGGNPQHLLDLPRDPIGVRGGQVDLVEGRHDGQIVLERHGAVGQGLGLDALGSIHEQDHALARRQGAGHLVSEVHMTGSVDQVDPPRAVGKAHALQLDGDAALPLEVHRVEVLRPHLPRRHRPAQLQETVGQR